MRLRVLSSLLLLVFPGAFLLENHPAIGMYRSRFRLRCYEPT